MTAIRSVINRDTLQRYGVVVIFFLVFSANCMLTSNFLSMTTVWNLIIQAMPTVFVAMGMTLVISARSIDISVGANMALGGVIFSLIIRSGAPPVLGLSAALAAGMLAGCVSGVLISKFGIQSMITTMASMYILRGLAMGISGGTSISFRNAYVSSFSYHRLGGVVPLHLVFVVALFIVIYTLLRKTRYGIYLEASGDNINAARVSGVNTVLAVTSAHVICGALAAFAGISQTIMVSSANGSALGIMFEGNAIASTVVGGTPMRGGRPNPIGTLFGAFLLTLIDIMVNMNHIYYAMSLVVKTLIIIMAVYLQKVGTSET